MLDLNDLPTDYPGGIGAAWAQAGAICLESQNRSQTAAYVIVVEFSRPVAEIRVK